MSDRFFCIEASGRKIHVRESDNGEHWVTVLGDCDGTCVPPAVELAPGVERAAMNFFAGVTEDVFGTDWLVPDACECELCDPDPASLAEKLVSKINRWSRRYRWTRSRRLVADFS